METSVKERKLNCLVTRKLMVDGSGALQATRDAGQALIGMALDEYIGRRSSTEIDIPTKSEIQKIKTYFGSNAPAEFSYTLMMTASEEQVRGSPRHVSVRHTDTWK